MDLKVGSIYLLTGGHILRLIEKNAKKTLVFRDLQDHVVSTFDPRDVRTMLTARDIPWLRERAHACYARDLNEMGADVERAIEEFSR